MRRRRRRPRGSRPETWTPLHTLGLAFDANYRTGLTEPPDPFDQHYAKAVVHLACPAGGTSQRWPHQRTMAPGRRRSERVGDAQNELTRRRLMRRSRYADNPFATVIGGPDDPHFVFNSDDLDNVLQLEAVAEFYANCTDPWMPYDDPRSGAGVNVPRAAGFGDYLTVDLLDPSGSAAREVPPTSGTVVTKVVLDGTVDLSRVWVREPGTGTAHRDLIYLAGATSRPHEWYKIMSIDLATRTVTLDTDPKMGGAACAWQIRLRPRLVLIDPLGPRSVSVGEHATLAGCPTPMPDRCGWAQVPRWRRSTSTSTLPT